MAMMVKFWSLSRRLLGIIAWLFFIDVHVFCLIQHSDVAVEVEGKSRPYSLCLHSQLNKVDNWLKLPPGETNTTYLAYVLLSMDKDEKLKDDKVALQSMIGWADARVTVAVLTRLDVRQRLRRSPTPPKLFITTASCLRIGLVDVMYTNPLKGQNQNESYPPWTMIDYNAFNIDEIEDWHWLLHARSALSQIVVPVASVLDLISTSSLSEQPSFFHSVNVVNVLKMIINLMRCATSGPYLIEGAKVSIEIPFCFNDEDISIHRQHGINDDGQSFTQNECLWLIEQLKIYIMKDGPQSVKWNIDVEFHHFKKDLNTNHFEKLNSHPLRYESHEHNAMSDDNLIAIEQWSYHLFTSKNIPKNLEHSYWSVIEVTYNNGNNQGLDISSSRSSRSVEGAFCLNLARREDRWKEMQLRWYQAFHRKKNDNDDDTMLTKQQHIELKRIEAVDGSTLFQFNHDIHDLDPSNFKNLLKETNNNGSSSINNNNVLSSSSSRYTRKELSKLFSLSSSSHNNLSPLNPYEDHGWRPSIIGCALSHRETWMEIASQAYGKHNIIQEFGSSYQKRELEISHLNETEHRHQSSNSSIYASYLVIEDDIEFIGQDSDFSTRFDNMMELANQQFDWDIIFLGALDDRDFYGDTPVHWSCRTLSSEERQHKESKEGVGNKRSTQFYDALFSKKFSNQNKIEAGGDYIKASRYHRHHNNMNCQLAEISSNGRVFGSGLFGYILRPRAAYNLLKASSYNSDHSITQPIDWWVWEKLNFNQHIRDSFRLKGLKAIPPLAQSPEGNERDSDNNEQYSSARFLELLHHSKHEEKDEEKEEFKIRKKTNMKRKCNNSDMNFEERKKECIENEEEYDEIIDEEEFIPKLMITYPPTINKPHYLSIEVASQGLGKVYVELSLSQDGMAGLWQEQHKFDLLCIEIKPIKLVIEEEEEKEDRVDTSGGGGGSGNIHEMIHRDTHNLFKSLKSRQCKPLYDADVLIPRLSLPGEYSMVAFLIGSDVEEIMEKEEISTPLMKHDDDQYISNKATTNPIRYINKEDGKPLIQSDLRYFRVAASEQEEEVPMTVTVDNVDEIILWTPSNTSLYDVAQNFCEGRLTLSIPQQLTSCINSMITAFLDLRRMGRGLHI